MIYLFLDTSTSNFNLLLFKDNKCIHNESIISNNNMTDFAVETLEKVLKINKIDYCDINEIYVTNGPGSFTGVRIALTIAKTIISIHSEIKLKVISTLEFQLGNKNGISLIDARSDSSYVLIRKNFKNNFYKLPIKNSEVTTLIELNQDLFVVKDMKNVKLLENFNECKKHFKECSDFKKATAVYLKKAF